VINQPTVTINTKITGIITSGKITPYKYNSKNSLIRFAAGGSVVIQNRSHHSQFDSAAFDRLKP
jgi:hypothetical protein